MKKIYEEYFKFGGIPSLLEIDDEFIKTNILTDIYNSIIVNDILYQHNIKDMDLFKRFVRYLINSTSQTFSKSSISNYLKNENRKTTSITISNYPKTIEREFSVLEEIPNNYPKYVISMDEIDMSQNGIIHMNLLDFLKDEEL